MKILCLLLLGFPLCGMDKAVLQPLHVESTVNVRNVATSVIDQKSHCLVAENKQVVEVKLKLFQPGCTVRVVTFSIDV